MTAARTTKVDVNQSRALSLFSSRSVRFINAGNLETLGAGRYGSSFVFSLSLPFEKREGAGLGASMSRVVEPAVAKGQRVNSSTAGGNTRRDDRSFAQSRGAGGDSRRGYLY